MDYRSTLNDIYRILKPIHGQLEYRRPLSGAVTETLPYIAITYRLQDSPYVDPFYHEIELKNSELYFESEPPTCHLPVCDIAELAGKSFEFEGDEWVGYFSNSLDAALLSLEFGALQDGAIACTSTFSLTNSPSYGMMDGTLEDHLTLQATFAMTLSVVEIAH
jgi:hypothetical protein